MRIHTEKDLAFLWIRAEAIFESISLIDKEVGKVIQNPSILTALIFLESQTNDIIPLDIIQKARNRENWEKELDALNHLFHKMEQSSVSWIAVLKGPCFDFSLQMALACDYRVADFTTVFGFKALSFGLIPPTGACLRLPRLIGLKKAFDMILKGQVISAQLAKSYGLVKEAIHPSDSKDKALELTQQIHKGLIPAKPPQKYQARGVWNQLWEAPLFRQIYYYRTKKQILKQTKGFYPAPLKVLELIKKTYPVTSLKANIKDETNSFCDLSVSPIAQNLIALYKTLKKMHLKTSYPNTHSIKKVVVIGAGAMGGGITGWLAYNNIPVFLKDIHAPSLSATLKYLYSHFKKPKSWHCFLRLKKIIPKTPLLSAIHPQRPLTYDKKDQNRCSLSFSKIRPQMDYSGFSSADLIIETVVEDMEIKKKVIAESARQSSQNSLFASNTSSFKISELARAHPHPDRFLGLHFFYPAVQSPLVEVVQGEHTNPETSQSICQWIRQNGKIPFLVKDHPGFLVHRLFLPLVSEVLWCLKAGSDIQHIDNIYTSFGFRLGPFALMDELGLDIIAKLITSFQKAGKPLSIPEEFSHFNPGFLGKKNKKGFYIYNDKRKIISVNNKIFQNVPVKFSFKNEGSILERGLYRMINEATELLEDKTVETAKEVDLALILGIGFPAFRGGLLKYAKDVSLKTVIAELYQFAHKWGDRFQPSSALLKLQEKDF